MKLPKTVIIAGKKYQVIKDRKSSGGWFGTQSQVIRIGVKDLTEEGILIVFLHEVIEAILTERNMRYRMGYQQEENGDILFSFNHYQFENAIQDIARALSTK